jgi:hypothetical protein
VLATEVVLLLKGGGNEVVCPKRRFAVQLSSSASFHEHMVLPVTHLLSEKTHGFTGDPFLLSAPRKPDKKKEAA